MSDVRQEALIDFINDLDSKIKEAAEGMEPGKIASQLAKKEEAITRNQAAIESIGLQLKEMRKEIKANSATLDGIRDIRNVSRIVQELKQKMDKVGEDRKFTSRTAGKIEAMFSDLSERLGEFQKFKDKISFNEETMHELMKTMDMLETRFEETSKKDDLRKLEGSIDERFERMNTGIDDKLYDTRKLIDELLTALKEGGIKGMLEKVGRASLERTFATKSDMEEIRAKLDRLREATMEAAREKEMEFGKESVMAGRPPAVRGQAAPRTMPSKAAPAGRMPAGAARPAPKPSPVLAIQDRVDSLINQAEEAIGMGNLDVSKNLYREALSLYNQLNETESYQEAAALYERIRQLYSRLRIYS